MYVIFEFNNLDISFGYGEMQAFGYSMQKEENVEFIFDFSSAMLMYEGTKTKKLRVKLKFGCI